MNTLFAKHDWRYLQEAGKGKDEAVLMPDSYMVHPDREEVFVTRHKLNKTVMVVRPTSVEAIDGSWKKCKIQWDREDLVKTSFSKMVQELRRGLGV